MAKGKSRQREPVDCKLAKSRKAGASNGEDACCGAHMESMVKVLADKGLLSDRDLFICLPAGGFISLKAPEARKPSRGPAWLSVVSTFTSLASAVGERFS